jgi:hypothetical protein
MHPIRNGPSVAAESRLRTSADVPGETITATSSTPDACMAASPYVSSGWFATGRRWAARVPARAVSSSSRVDAARSSPLPVRVIKRPNE